MSYEGYVEYLCETGHLFIADCSMDAPAQCPHCEKPTVWRHSVDQTNGVVRGDPGTRPTRLKQVGEDVWMQEMRRPVFAIPATGRIAPSADGTQHE